MDPLKTLLFISTLILFSCGKNFNQQVRPPNERDIKAGLRLRGITGDQFNEQLPIVLLFSTVNCDGCIKEHQMLVKSMKRPKDVLKNVQFHTYIIDKDTFGDIQEIASFKSDLAIPWAVTGDFDRVFFKKYCSKNTVPCLVIFTPEDGLVLTHNGRLTLEEIQKHTGKWESGDNDGPGDNPDDGDQENPKLKLEGTYPFINLFNNKESIINLADNKAKKTLLLFGSTNCIDCEIEHDEVAQKGPDYFKYINIYSVIVSSKIYFEDWVDLGVFWPLADARLTPLFEKYCESKVTPCTIIFDEKNRLIFRHSGAISLSKIEENL